MTNLPTGVVETRAAFDAAKDRYRAAVEGFPHWWESLSPKQKIDPFFLALRSRYEPEFQRTIAEVSQPALRAVLETCKLGGARFASVWWNDLVIFEGRRFPTKPRDYFARPLAWNVADWLNIWRGAGNGPQAQVNLKMISRGDCGSYDLTGEVPKRVGSFLALYTMKFKGIETVFRGENLQDYLGKAGVRFGEDDDFDEIAMVGFTSRSDLRRGWWDSDPVVTV